MPKDVSLAWGRLEDTFLIPFRHPLEIHGNLDPEDSERTLIILGYPLL